MYITPNTDIILMEGVPLDNTYTDTIYFDDRSVQENYFKTSYDRFELSGYSYQRVNENTFKAGVKPDKLRNVNYMMFRNLSHSPKWYYAFVLQVNYINEETAEVVYEIDVMQTWICDAVIMPSYVEREHVTEDGVGQHCAAEPVDLGLINCDEIVETDFFQSYCAVIAMADDSSTSTTALNDNFMLPEWTPGDDKKEVE